MKLSSKCFIQTLLIRLAIITFYHIPTTGLINTPLFLQFSGRSRAIKPRFFSQIDHMVRIDREFPKSIHKIICKQIRFLPCKIFAARLYPITIRQTECQIIDQRAIRRRITQFLQCCLCTMSRLRNSPVFPPFMKFHVIHLSTEWKMILRGFISSDSAYISLVRNFHQTHSDIFVHQIIFTSFFSHTLPPIRSI